MFYKIEPSIEISVVGDFPQIQKFKKGYNMNRRESCSQIARYFFGKKPDVQVDFDGLQLSNKAKTTDYLSSSYLNNLTGMLVSSGLFNYLTSLKIPEFIKYRATIYKKEQILAEDFYWIHFIKSYPELINFSESSFFLNHSEVKFKDIYINDILEYTQKQSSVAYKIEAKRLVLHKGAINFDLIRIGIIENRLLVTEEIMRDLVSKNFMGFQFNPADNIVIG